MNPLSIFRRRANIRPPSDRIADLARAEDERRQAEMFRRFAQQDAADACAVQDAERTMESCS